MHSDYTAKFFSFVGCDGRKYRGDVLLSKNGDFADFFVMFNKAQCKKLNLPGRFVRKPKSGSWKNGKLIFSQSGAMMPYHKYGGSYETAFEAFKEEFNTALKNLLEKGKIKR